MSNLNIQAGSDPGSELREELEKILRQCEKELMELSLITREGGNIQGFNFHTPVFRFLWLRLTEPLAKASEFYGRGLRY